MISGKTGKPIGSITARVSERVGRKFSATKPNVDCGKMYDEKFRETTAGTSATYV